MERAINLETAEFPADVASVRDARRFVVQTVARWGVDVADDAALLTSELATNAVLHAGSPYVVTVQRTDLGVRVEVTDASSQHPRRRRYRRSSGTGRGLGLVDDVADAWGVDHNGTGKRVWFVLVERSNRGVRDLLSDVDDVDLGRVLENLRGIHDDASRHGHPASGRVTDLIEVRILGLPVRLANEAQEHFAELSREFLHLSTSDTAVRGDTPGRLLALGDQFRREFAAFTIENEQLLDEAIARGDHEINLVYHLPAAVGPAATGLAELLDEADRYCVEGNYLLTLRTPPGALAFRRWYLAELANQVAGADPVSFDAWRGTR